MTINEIQDEIIEEFQDFDDWMDRYQLLIDMGSDQPELPVTEVGCQFPHLVDNMVGKVHANLLLGKGGATASHHVQ